MRSHGRPFGSRLITWFFVVILAVAAFKMAMWVIGVVFGIGGFLLFTVLPLVVVGWLVIMLVRALGRNASYQDT